MKRCWNWREMRTVSRARTRAPAWRCVGIGGKCVSLVQESVRWPEGYFHLEGHGNCFSCWCASIMKKKMSWRNTNCDSCWNWCAGMMTKSWIWRDTGIVSYAERVRLHENVLDLERNKNQMYRSRCAGMITSCICRKHEFFLILEFVR